MSNSTDQSKIQGEGDYEAARVYDDATAKFAKSGKVEKAAQDAKKAVDGPERAELERAEAEGKSHAKK